MVDVPKLRLYHQRTGRGILNKVMQKSEELHILFVIHSLSGGGSERRLSFYMNHLEEHGISSCAVVTYNEGIEHIEGFKERVIHLPKTSKYDLRVSRLRKIIQEQKPHQVHAWLPTTFPGGYLAACLSRVPFYVSYDYRYGLFSSSYLPDRIGSIVAIISSLSHGICANIPGSLMQEPFKFLFTLKKGVYLPNIVDVAAIDKASKASLSELSLHEHAPILLFAGRFVWQKNVSLLLHAFRLLLQKKPDAVLLLVGDGPGRNRLEELTKSLGIDKSVHFIGFRADVWSYMKSADALVLCSHGEGMPNVLCEAMIARTPIIATDIPQHRYLLDEGARGYLIPELTPESLADIMETRIDAPEETIERMKDDSYQFAKDTFSLEKSLEIFVDHFKNAPKRNYRND